MKARQLMVLQQGRYSLKLIVFLLVGVTLCLRTNIRADDLWVDNTVISTGDGSHASPYKSIKEAIHKASPGSTINVLNKGLSYKNSTYLLNNIRNLIILGVDDINGTKPVIQPQNVYAVDIDSSYHITVENFDFDLSKNVDPKRSFVVRYGEHITIKNCIFRNGNYHNIDIRRGQHFVIKNNLIHDIMSNNGDAHGIVIDGEAFDVIIRNNEIYDCSGDCIQLEYSSDGTPTNITIQDNRLYRSTIENSYYLNMGKQAQENAIDVKEAKNLIIRGNTICNFVDVATSSPAAVLVRARKRVAIRNVLIEYNDLYNNDNCFTFDRTDAGIVCDSIVIRRNVIHDGIKTVAHFIAGGALHIEDATNIKIYQNTFYNMHDHFFSFDEGGPVNIDIRNNLFAQPEDAWPVDFSFCVHGNPENGFNDDVIVRHNGYFGISDGASICGTCIRTDQTETEENIIVGADGQGIFVDLTNNDIGQRDFHLSGAVGPIDAGEILSEENENGEIYFGRAPDLGRWEYK